MRARIRRGKQHVLRLDIHMDNSVPTRLMGRRLIGPMAAIAERVRHGVENMPQESLGKDKAVCASSSILTAVHRNFMGRGNTVACDTKLSDPRDLRGRHIRNRSCAWALIC